MTDIDFGTHIHRIGSASDNIAELLHWVRSDWRDYREGFRMHQDMLIKAVQTGDLYVATCSGVVMGYQLGETNVDLVQVHSRYRHQGVGAALVWAVVSRAAKTGASPCVATTSDPTFWRAIGFAEIPVEAAGGSAGVLMGCEPETWLADHAHLAPASSQ